MMRELKREAQLFMEEIYIESLFDNKVCIRSPWSPQGDQTTS